MVGVFGAAGATCESASRSRIAFPFLGVSSDPVGKVFLGQLASRKLEYFSHNLRIARTEVRSVDSEECYDSEETDALVAIPVRMLRDLEASIPANCTHPLTFSPSVEVHNSRRWRCGLGDLIELSLQILAMRVP